ncbi:hypothetical protein MRB53_038776 [Persea americana]|nr:hypothetical protein MRB53_038776 [Persea americana]
MPAREPGKAKLKAFQFAEGQPKHSPLSQDADKENAAAEVQAVEKIASAAPVSSPSKPPSTPAIRLPLADLIGDTDDNDSLQGRKPSPQDQILWNHTRSPPSSPQKSTPAANGRKRARSSSPPSTAQHRAIRQRLDIAKNVRGVQMDPAVELWNRYAMDASKDAPTALQLEAFTKLLADCEDGRAVECNGHVCDKSEASQEKQPQNSLEDVFVDETGESSHDEQARTAKRNKIGSLIERIQQSFAQPVEQAVGEKAHMLSPTSLPYQQDKKNEAARLVSTALSRQSVQATCVQSRASPSGARQVHEASQASSSFGAMTWIWT